MRYIFKGPILSRSSLLILAIPLLLSSFTHFWNLTGFPAIYMDEDIYLRKALRALEGAPLEADRSNPVYGWLFLALGLGAIGYPDSLQPSTDSNTHSIEMLYLAPRLFMGMLAVLDTFLIFKICEYHYNNRKVALIASILFAVMPMTWITRYALLESIQLPFLLSSILFAVNVGKKRNNTNNNNMVIILSILFSGIFLGLAVFAKTPAFAMVPLLGFLIYRNSKSLKILGLWLIPVFLLPLVSPAYANSLGMFNIWWDGNFYQINRENRPLLDFSDQNPDNAIRALLRIDPFLLVAGSISIIFLSIRKDLLVLLWTVPYVMFFYFVGYVSFYHFIPIFPAFCIAFAKLIVFLSDRITTRNKMICHVVPYAIIAGVGVFGLINTIMLITTNINSTHFQAAAIIAHHLPATDNSNASRNGITVIMGENRFFWILQQVFHKDYEYTTYWDYKSPINETEKIIIIAEGTFDYWKRTETNKTHVKELLNIYNNSQTVAVLNRNSDMYDHTKYPYTSLSLGNLGIGRVEIRTNPAATNLFLDMLNHGT
jgi:hypothetical protein